MVEVRREFVVISCGIDIFSVREYGEERLSDHDLMVCGS